MDKLLLVVDQGINAGNVLDQAFALAKKNDAVLTGVFVQDLTLVDYYTVLGGEPVYYEHTFQIIKDSLSESEKKTIDLINYFVDQCKKANVRFKVHFDKGDPVEEVVNETMFADLLLMGYRSYNTFASDSDQLVVKQLLSRSRCPILLLPENARLFESVALCYDGSESSMRAIDEYYHTFKPACANWDHYLVRVFDQADTIVPAEEGLIEILQLRFPKLNWVDLVGKPKEEIPYFASQKGDPLVVMGAYGKSGIARFFSGSTADHLLKSGALQAFITH